MMISVTHQVLLGDDEGACGGQVGKESDRGLKRCVRCRRSNSKIVKI